VSEKRELKGMELVPSRDFGVISADDFYLTVTREQCTLLLLSDRLIPKLTREGLNEIPDRIIKEMEIEIRMPTSKMVALARSILSCTQILQEKREVNFVTSSLKLRPKPRR